MVKRPPFPILVQLFLITIRLKWKSAVRGLGTARIIYMIYL